MPGEEAIRAEGDGNAAAVRSTVWAANVGFDAQPTSPRYHGPRIHSQRYFVVAGTVPRSSVD